MNCTFKILPIAVIVATAWAAHAQQVAYSPSMLRALVPEGQDVDVSFLQKGFDIPPGVYNFAVFFNGEIKSYSNVEIREYANTLEPVFRINEIKSWPLKESVLEKLSKFKDDDEVFPLSQLLEGASVNVNAKEMKLEISVPQIYIASNDGWVDVVDPKLWDYGEPGAVINYSFSGNHIQSRTTDYEGSTLYGNLSARLNVGAWRLYTSGSVSASKTKTDEFSSTTHNWDIWNTYLQRDIPDWKGTLQLGELNTTGEIFDSVPIRGFRISTNEQMLPYRDRAYAPIIEGIANTNAQIIIRQNGHVVHTLNVAPGPFRLEDLPHFGSYGDLEVIIRESDGTERIINVPYSSVPNMLREGQFRYDANVGRFYYKNQPAEIDNPYLFMGTLQYGLPKDITVYGGTLLSEGYYAFALGTGLSLGSLGAIAADVTQSNYRKDYDRGVNEDGHGAAWRVRYEKTMTETGTTVNLANYQYISGRYASFQDFVEYGTSGSSYLFGHGRLKSRWQIALSQSLGQIGSLSLGGEYAQYSGDASDVKSFNAGYFTHIKGVGVSLNYSRNYYQTGLVGKKNWESNHTVMLNLNIPLSLFYRNSTSSFINSTSVNYLGTMHKQANGERSYQQSVVMNGYSHDADLSWSLTQELGNHEERSSSLSLGYTGNRVNATFGIDHNHATNNYQLGLSGAVVLHKTGITLSPNAYDSVAVIEVPDAEGVKVSQSFDARTDMFGNAILPYLTNYTKNEISIDPSTLPDGAMLLDSTNRITVPAAGSIVRLKYPVRFGKQAVLVLRDQGNKPLAFGSRVELVSESGENDPFVSGIVGEAGRIYLTGLPSSGAIRALNGDKSTYFKYNLSDVEVEKNDDFVTVPVIELRPTLLGIEEN